MRGLVHFCMISCVILSALVEQKQALFRVFSNIARLLQQTNRPRGLLHSLQSLFDLLETLTDGQIRPQQPLLHEAASAGATLMESVTAQLVLRPHECSSTTAAAARLDPSCESRVAPVTTIVSPARSHWHRTHRTPFTIV